METVESRHTEAAEEAGRWSRSEGVVDCWRWSLGMDGIVIGDLRVCAAVGWRGVVLPVGESGQD